MLLKNLIENCPNHLKKVHISGLALDSRKIKKGNLFFALKGRKHDGKKFIKEAIYKGARAILVPKNYKFYHDNIPIIKVKNIKKILADSCKKFFREKPKNIILVTGTNGKSSIADFFSQIFYYNKIPVATIGTLGVSKNRIIKKTNLTSLDIISLHSELQLIKKKKIDNVIIEASSHGLHQGRLDGLNVKAGIFSNFSQDHLDYHKTMKKYFEAKMILFKKLLNKNGFIITDEHLKEFSKIQSIANKKKIKILNFSKLNILQNENLKNLKGTFQKKNLSMSILAANLCGLSNKNIKPIIKKIKNVNGRLELVRVLPNKSKVFIDFAHTPNALETVLETLKIEYRNDITLVFGCGGERDKKKRPLMAKIAKKYCKKIYITDDNPRNENPKKIRNELKKIVKSKNTFEIGDRSKAIQEALKNSKPYEIIIIAGKGHEKFQDYGNKILKTSDKQSVLNVKIINKYFNKYEYNLEYNSNILNKILNLKNKHKFYGVSIDSQKVEKGNLFIAIKGKNRDGHKYISSAKKNGANICVISKKFKIKDKKKIIKVSNTFSFLNRLGLEKRNVSKAEIIAVTGSAGKTSVKTLLGNLLKHFEKTYYSPKSFNNHYGVPISLCNLEYDHKFGVFEVGMSKKGEIHRLSKIINPDIAIITNVAEAHIENFKNIKDIAKTKGEIINNIKEGGTIVLNRDDKFFNYFHSLAKKRGLKIVSFGFSKKSDVKFIHFKNNIVKIKAVNEIIEIKNKDINTLNLLCSIAVLKILNLNIHSIVKFCENIKPLQGRGKIHLINRYNTSFNLVDESYNANPLSVKKAIFNLNNIKKNKFNKYLLLGDMLELGKNSDFYHQKLSNFINSSDIDKVFVYGDKILNAYKYIKKNKQGNILQFKNDFDEVFSKILKKNDFLMIKGSNSTGLHKLSSSLIKGIDNVI